MISMISHLQQPVCNTQNNTSLLSRRAVLGTIGACAGVVALGGFAGVASAVPVVDSTLPTGLTVGPECEILGHVRNNTTNATVTLTAVAVEGGVTTSMNVPSDGMEYDLELPPGSYSLRTEPQVDIFDADTVDEGEAETVVQPVTIGYCPTDVRIEMRKGQLRIRNTDTDYTVHVSVSPGHLAGSTQFVLDAEPSEGSSVRIKHSAYNTGERHTFTLTASPVGTAPATNTVRVNRTELGTDGRITLRSSR